MYLSFICPIINPTKLFYHFEMHHLEFFLLWNILFTKSFIESLECCSVYTFCGSESPAMQEEKCYSHLATLQETQMVNDYVIFYIHSQHYTLYIISGPLVKNKHIALSSPDVPDRFWGLEIYSTTPLLLVNESACKDLVINISRRKKENENWFLMFILIQESQTLNSKENVNFYDPIEHLLFRWVHKVNWKNNI